MRQEVELLSQIDLRFESSVNPEGTQTFIEARANVLPFESNVRDFFRNNIIPK